MIKSEFLENMILVYKGDCDSHGRDPTYAGLSRQLGISEKTVSRVVCGLYNGRPYSSHPHVRRCIGNADFEIVREVFVRGRG